jgi:hypothetical protein
MTKFMNDLDRGMAIGFKLALTGYLICFVGVMTFAAPFPWLLVGGNFMTGALDMIWGR